MKIIDRPTLAQVFRHYAKQRKEFKAVLRELNQDYSLKGYDLKMLENNYIFLKSIEEEKKSRYNSL